MLLGASLGHGPAFWRKNLGRMACRGYQSDADGIRIRNHRIDRTTSGMGGCRRRNQKPCFPAVRADRQGQSETAWYHIRAGSGRMLGRI